MKERVESEKEQVEIDVGEGVKWYPPELIPKTVQIKRTVSIPTAVLAAAGVDLSKDIYGRWVVDRDDYLLEISYKEGEGFSRLIRPSLTSCRLTYVPNAVRNRVENFSRFFWTAEGKNVLRFVPAKNRIKIKRFLGYCVVDEDRLLLPRIFSASHCILGFADGFDFIIAIPDDSHGVSVSVAGSAVVGVGVVGKSSIAEEPKQREGEEVEEEKEGREKEEEEQKCDEVVVGVKENEAREGAETDFLEVDLKPLPAPVRAQLARQFRLPDRWLCWEGFAEIMSSRGPIERKCIVLSPVVLEKALEEMQLQEERQESVQREEQEVMEGEEEARGEQVQEEVQEAVLP
ncbi:hypothetical protein Ferp_0461 [Ferroglobus placidus DSM 10642]|uniref:Uncharacterized protein n=1 Tax=Ferroglobus placidus (strain DSM 10642 / AEDII12DO) TaxID=589924 RepID=D3S302_FERPA|nr:hypothetical protein [Ferroglobus placidus]ADC64635.1 hypothetical protein Ferp_0461 [Ferroglobus placidus DSM 10642]